MKFLFTKNTKICLENVYRVSCSSNVDDREFTFDVLYDMFKHQKGKCKKKLKSQILKRR